MNYFSYLCTLNRDNRQMNKLKDLHKGEASNASYDHVLKYTGIFGGVQGLKRGACEAYHEDTGQYGHRSDFRL